MRDVAREAGVSVMTVSYAYGDPGRVGDRTRRLVLEAAARLGYPGPHPAAQSLRTGRTGTLGVVLGEHLTYAFDDPQATAFLAGVAGVCVEHELGMTLIPVTGAPTDAARLREAAVDALVLWTTVDGDPLLDVVRELGTPAVMHGGPQVEGLGLVSIDDRAAARAVAEVAFAGARHPAVLSFPLDRGRRSDVLLGPDADAAPFPITRRRLQGYADACGAGWAQVPVVVLARNDTVEAEQAAARLLDDGTVDAVAAMSDQIALGVLRAARRLGRGVPDQLAVTGWDDSPAAEAAGLTTVAQSLREQGATCARRALGVEPPGEPVLAPWQLVRRTTTRDDA
jgi:DNA-binding LacI/PurR family transcriptional regulator